MKLATWNLARPARSGARTERTLAMIGDVKADVWVLTETREQLRPSEGYVFAAHSSIAKDRGIGETWVSIWSKTPGEKIPLQADPERSAAALVNVSPERPVIVIGTVLPWLGDTRQEQQRGSVAFQAALEGQAQEWSDIAARYDGVPICVAGDFNQDLVCRHYYGSGDGRKLLRATLARHNLKCLTGDELDPVSLATSQRAASVDHICVSKAVENAKIVSVWPEESEVGPKLSDHFGVCAEIS